MKYIDADKLIAEINNLNSVVPYNRKDRHDDGLHDAYYAIIKRIQSLQQEQEADYSEFEKALNEFGEAYATLVDRDNNPNQGIRINAYHELVQKNISRILELAKEYANREQPEGLDEAANDYCSAYYDWDNEGERSAVVSTFKAGAEWMAGREKLPKEDEK